MIVVEVHFGMHIAAHLHDVEERLGKFHAVSDGVERFVARAGRFLFVGRRRFDVHALVYVPAVWVAKFPGAAGLGDVNGDRRRAQGPREGGFLKPWKQAKKSRFERGVIGNLRR